MLPELLVEMLTMSNCGRVFLYWGGLVYSGARCPHLSSVEFVDLRPILFCYGLNISIHLPSPYLFLLYAVNLWFFAVIYFPTAILSLTM